MTSTTFSRTLALALASLLAAGEFSLIGARRETAPPLRNEDVVRMVARGDAIEEILAAIRQAASTQFELEPDMLIELRRARVPERVLEAMIERQRPPAAPATPTPTPSESPGGAVELVFQRDPAAEIRRGTAVTLENDPNNRPVELAFFAVCLDPLHVPNLWYDRTPLKSAFPRHEMLWLLEATRPGKASRRAKTVFLDLPDRHSVAVPAGRHPLMLGVAARSGGSEWMPLATVTTTLEVRASEATRVVLLVRTAKVQQIAPGAGPTPWITCEVVRTEPAGPSRP